MASANKVFLIGRLGKKPDITILDNGNKKVFTILGTSERYRDNNSNWVEQTEWHIISLFGSLAEDIIEGRRNYVKGDLLYIEGKLETIQYRDNNGTILFRTEIKADRIMRLDDSTIQLSQTNLSSETISSTHTKHIIPKTNINTFFKGNVLIVSKTKMKNNKVCVGGIDLDNNRSVRLLDSNGNHFDTNNCPFEKTMQTYFITYQPHPRQLPHYEDIIITSYNKTYNTFDRTELLSAINKAKIPFIVGSLRHTFEGKLKQTPNNTLFISQDAISNHSTCFWICDSDLQKKDINERIRFSYYDNFYHQYYTLPYVGFDIIPSVIPKGTLIRLSLANWWAPISSSNEPRCYLQLSGIY